MNLAKMSAFVTLMLLVSVLATSGIADVEADQGLTVDKVDFDPVTMMLYAEGTSSSNSVRGFIQSTEGMASSYFAFDVEDGKWSGKVSCQKLEPSDYTLVMFVSSTAVVNTPFTVSDVTLEPSSKSLSVYKGGQAVIDYSISGASV